MAKQQIISKQNEKLKELHWKIQQWKTQFQVIDDEILFLERLLNSSAFKPNIPNLFERLEGYKIKTEELKNDLKLVRNSISVHENSLGEMLDVTENKNNEHYYQVHNQLNTDISDCYKNFQKLKSEIFNYTGTIFIT
ncbi:hypothetical protein DFQ03_1291 [Maribacter caenipelagi]|uniref:Uncharacterized protein n=1 Tax=Maribacter caenipelagi TaxID=1447781 RepID=A0A4R7DAB0_9FLAO|nr:hypothetical protein [Maribacter caenipelagi]TDS16804.1 hypothetical protein DFQ03_1291 [Maribacter caenipelagi]